jgi:hypothetical protein
MARRQLHRGRAEWADRSAPNGAGFLFGIGLTIAWLRLQLASLLRPRVS